MSFAMNKIFVSLMIAGLVTLSCVISLEMKTAFVKTEKTVRWTIQDLNELNFMTHVTNYGTNYIESSPFLPFENSGEEWVIGLVTSGTHLTDGPVISIYIRSLDTSRSSDQFIGGTVTFRNISNHILSVKRIDKSALVWEENMKNAPEKIVFIMSQEKLVSMLPDLRIPPGVSSLPLVLEKLNCTLILDFSLNLVAPVTAFII